jgi:hypothetical protein
MFAEKPACLPAAGENDVGGDREPEGVIADHWDIDKYADHRKTGDEERKHKCEVHCRTSFRRPQDLLPPDLQRAEPGDGRVASVEGPSEQNRGWLQRLPHNVAKPRIRIRKSTSDSGNFEGSVRRPAALFHMTP